MIKCLSDNVQEKEKNIKRNNVVPRTNRSKMMTIVVNLTAIYTSLKVDYNCHIHVRAPSFMGSYEINRCKFSVK